MSINVWALDAVAGAPSYTGRAIRQAQSALVAGATSARPLGGRSGVRPGTSSTTVTASSTTWTVKSHAGVLDVEPAAEAAPYLYAVNADVTGSITAADGTNPRKDIVYVRVSDPAESDGSTTPKGEVLYLAGTPATSPSAPATPARSMVLAEILVPKVGGGSPSVTWKAQTAVAAGGVVPVASTTERSALPAYSGLVIARTDTGVLEQYDGTTWRPITSMMRSWGSPVDGQATPAAGTVFQRMAGKLTVTPNASGVVTITLPGGGFPNGLLYGSGGIVYQSAVAGAVLHPANGGSKSTLLFVARDNAGAAVTTSIDVWYEAVGW